MRLSCPALRLLLPLLAGGLLLGQSLSAGGIDDDWSKPPQEARLRAYWWWLNGNVTKAAITRDLEQMKAKGFGGALLCDAGGADQRGNDKVPAGPAFFSAEWRELYRHTLAEAERLGLELSLNIQSGWNLGGPMIKPEDSVKKLVWSETLVKGPAKAVVSPLKPATLHPYYQDLFVVACKRRPLELGATKTLPNLRVKTLQEKIKFTGRDAWFLANSAPDTNALWSEDPEAGTAADSSSADVVDLTDSLSSTGSITWDAPPGDWIVLRFGCTLGDNHEVSTSSDGWKGLALDVLDPQVLRNYWDLIVEPLIADAGPRAGKTLRYLHTDSWEIGVFNWTRTLRSEFRARRGYDLLPFMPVFAGMIVDSPEISTRFLHDYRKTLGDLAVDNHYALLRDWAAPHGIGIHPEAGGPHFTPIDAQRCLGITDVPMSEFWAESPSHRTSEATRFFVKQPASAAHTYGKRLVAAESFTTVGPHWEERLADNLKPSFDQAACEGLNRVVWHAFVCSPAEMGIPGQQYFAGTHLNPNVTWWEKAGPFFDYLNRCQAMLQRGLFVADVLTYYGDHVPNFAQSRSSDPAGIGGGRDYDVLTEEALLTRVQTKDGRLVLPDGMSYRLLVLPPHPGFSLPALRKIRELVKAGAKVSGQRPSHAAGLSSYPASETEFKTLVDELWNAQRGPLGYIDERSASEILKAEGLAPDFEAVVEGEGKVPSTIHRRDGATEIYFIANRDKKPVSFEARFRVSGLIPELWNPVSGQRSQAKAWRREAARTCLPLELPACGSLFVVFQKPSDAERGSGDSNAEKLEEVRILNEAWTLSFDPKWGGPESIVFEKLISWTHRPEAGVKFYSGTATYRIPFLWDANDASLQGRKIFLDLGEVRELASPRLNGHSLGVLWSYPFRADISSMLKDGENILEVEVVNFWPNRIIGDRLFPTGKPYTRTNIRTLTKDSRLLESGLLGPVKILRSQ